MLIFGWGQPLHCQADTKKKKREALMPLNSHTFLTGRGNKRSGKVRENISAFSFWRNHVGDIFQMGTCTYFIFLLSVMNSRKMDNIIVSFPVRSSICLTAKNSINYCLTCSFDWLILTYILTMFRLNQRVGVVLKTQMSKVS